MKRLFTLIAAAMVFVGGYAQTYKEFTETTVFIPTSANITAAKTNGLMPSDLGTTPKNNQKFNVTIETGVESPSEKKDFMAVKNSSSNQRAVFNVTGVSGIIFYYAAATEESILTISAKSEEGSDDESIETTSLKKNVSGISSISLNPQNHYVVTLDGKNSGNTINIFGVTFIKGESAVISKSGYTTYTAAYPVDYSASNLTAYYAKYANGTITYTEVEGSVPANTPILISGKAESTVELIPATTAAKAVNSDLKSADGSTIKGDGTIYGFGTKDGKSGFRRVANDVVVPAKKAYLVINDVANSKEFFAFDNETTGISAVETTAAKAENGVAYSLSGQRVGDSYKGIVIINGKKIVRK